ncbi:hypothetical protein COT99_02780 [Candidatus Falkowbacteria bacterium CG10_big_fil_rev_8_21_14_0_10_43_10]|uniref:Uncharacterized protein n=1 Tax=Candidatus Falkowbacteria bacterium CG10_big_fil_rev_8_21_14_0_10_43_10 TaxID=1974567 RepID=A0A2H0V1W4_9BACT|nr:MAG: hypothetical protein AUJ72_05945 [Candidatus Omnitrophica bacterium CG1_02_46_14]PIR93086.1 MAG: hypothetical protein COT99_02780 [Candidatus Falkowbacteria bacterium CG10_big_fil_rev_8_21_14_0_10_43_10]
MNTHKIIQKVLGLTIFNICEGGMKHEDAFEKALETESSDNKTVQAIFEKIRSGLKAINNAAVAATYCKGVLVDLQAFCS